MAFRLLISSRLYQTNVKVSILSLFLIMAFSPLVNAIDASQNTPIVRVDPGTHSAPATGIRYFDKGRKIVTTSLDKTIRIWRSRDFKLLKTLRIPIDLGLEGRLYFVDVNPDGTRLVAGGHTCFEWEKQACLYVFDPNTGRLLQRIEGLKNTIANLKFSPDGKTLAVGMAKGGVMFFNTRDFSVISQDKEFGSAVAGLDMSVNGYTVVSSLDGYLRIYDAAFKLVARQKMPDLKMIGSTFFSPNGNKLLLGSFETARFEILSFPALKRIALVDLKAQGFAQETLRNVFWSSSGKYIFGSGDAKDLSTSTVYRWQVNNLSQPSQFSVPTHRISGMRTFVDDQFLFSTEDGFVGTANKEGEILASSQLDILQFPINSPGFQLSEDGSIVAIPNAKDGSSVVFNTKIPEILGVLNPPVESPAVDYKLKNAKAFKNNKANRRDKSRGVTMAFPDTNENETTYTSSKKVDQDWLKKLPKLTSAKTTSHNFKLTNWEDSSKPTLNGRQLDMFNAFEFGRSFAVAPNDETLVLGTEIALRAYNKKGDLLWMNMLASGSVWNVAATPNGKLVVATLSDGTVRWYRMSDGKEEVLALFLRANQQDWAMWRPDGYYASSELGDNLIGWHVNRGKTAEPDFYRAVQFERQFYRPDLMRNQIASVIGVNPLTADTLPDAFNIQHIDRIAPPRIRIDTHLLSQTGEIEVNVSADKMSQSMRDITLYANQLPVTKNAERQLKTDERDTFHRTFRFPAGSGDNLIRVEVNNGVSLGLAEQWIEASLKKTASPVKGNLYVLAVGVNKFDQRPSNSSVNVPDLSFADNDAVELAELLEKTKKKSEFNQVHIQVLSDSSDKQPTHQNILVALRVFEQAEPNDTVLLFLASHGFSDAKGNYYFMPKDGKFSEVEAVLTGNNSLEKPTSLLSWTDFIDGMRSASGKRIMIVDTCRAKNIFGEFDAKSLRKRSAAALFPLLLASKGNESSQEYQPAQHGLFTYALLKGLSGLANTNHDKKVSLGELNEYIVPLVDKLHNPRLGSQTPQLIAPNALSEIGVSIYGD